MKPYLDKRRNRWTYDFKIGGERHAGYCKDPMTGKEATGKAEAARFLALIYQQKSTGAAQQSKRPDAYSLAQAVAAYTTATNRRASFESLIQGHIDELMLFFGPGTPLAHINETELDRYVAWARERKVLVRTGGPTKEKNSTRTKETGRLRSPSTINRYLTTLRAILTKANKTRDRHTGKPLLEHIPNVPMQDEPQHVPRPWTLAELRAVAEQASPHVREVMTIAVMTGLRRQSCLALRIRDIDLDRQVLHKGIHNKARRDGDVPLPDAAIPFFRGLIEQAHSRGTDRLVTYRPRGSQQWRPVADIKTAFLAAQDRAGIEVPKRFHALKSTAISFAAEQGADPKTLQAIGDHKSFATTERHYLGEAVERRKRAMQGVGQTLVDAGILPRPADPETADPA